MAFMLMSGGVEARVIAGCALVTAAFAMPMYYCAVRRGDVGCTEKPIVDDDALARQQHRINAQGSAAGEPEFEAVHA